MFSLILFIIALLIAGFGTLFLFVVVCHYAGTNAEETFIAENIRNYLKPSSDK